MPCAAAARSLTTTHLGNEEAARDGVAVHRERAVRHLHLVALRRPRDAERGRADALVPLALAVPLAEERGEDRRETLRPGARIAPGKAAFPAAAAEFPDFQQNLGRSNIPRQNQLCLLRREIPR